MVSSFVWCNVISGCKFFMSIPADFMIWINYFNSNLLFYRLFGIFFVGASISISMEKPSFSYVISLVFFYPGLWISMSFFHYPQASPLSVACFKYMNMYLYDLSYMTRILTVL